MRLSNDGRRISDAVGSWTLARLFVADVDGSHARALTDSVGYWYNVAWSPDDRRIAVTHGDSARSMQVWVVDVARAQAHPLTSFAADQGRPQWPAWSADGKRVAFQAGHYDRAHPEASTSDVFVADVATGAVQRITPRDRAWMDETPSWCPDGRHLVIQSTRTGAFELWRIGVANGPSRQLTGR
jgi:TolB protein